MFKMQRKSNKSKVNLETSLKFINGESLKKNAEQQALHAKMQADLYYLQGWFIRASWENKAKFIKITIRSLKDVATVKNIIEALRPMVKDILYAGAHTTKYSYDIMPNDHDRCLDETALNTNIEMHLYWLNSVTIDESDKLNVILHLIKIGGTQLAKLALAEAQILGKILDYLALLEMRHSKLKRTQGLATTLSRARNKNQHIIPLTNEYKQYSTLQNSSEFQRTSEKISKGSKRQSKGPDRSSKKQLAEPLNNLKNKQKLWNKELKNLLRMALTGLPERTMLFTANKIELDSLQLLPVWINRQIVNLLDKKSKQNLEKVSRYWKYTIQEVELEKRVREKLNVRIKYLEKKLMKTKLPGKRFVTPIRKVKRRARSAGRRRKHKKTKKFAELEETLRKPIEIKDDFKESIYKFIKKIPSTRIPFQGLYNDMIIQTIYMYDRSIDCNRRLIAATENTFIAFYNIITGAKTPIILSGHSLVVTCVAFIPNTFRIVSGSLDRTVRTWNLWNRKVIEIFRGHHDGIISVSANEEYVVSCGQDKQLRVFKQLSNGMCIKLIHHAHWKPTMAILSEDNLVYWSTTEGAIKMFSITDENINKSIKTAHAGIVTYIGKFGKLIVTIGNDNYVRIWNANFIYDKCIIAFLHDCGVNSVIITCLTLITTCTDGALRFWHIGTGLLFRKLQVNFAEVPMISLKCQEYYNHVKIVCNNEANIYVLEFAKSFKTNFRNNPYQGIGLHPLSGRKKVSTKNGRLIKQHIHKCTLPEYRKCVNYKYCLSNTGGILNDILLETGN